MHHEYSVEILTHLICGACRRPWTVSDTLAPFHDVLACPYCGERRTLKPMPPLPTVLESEPPP